MKFIHVRDKKTFCETFAEASKKFVNRIDLQTKTLERGLLTLVTPKGSYLGGQKEIQLVQEDEAEFLFTFKGKEFYAKVKFYASPPPIF